MDIIGDDPTGYIIVGAIALLLWIGWGFMVWKTKKLW